MNTHSRQLLPRPEDDGSAAGWTALLVLCSILGGLIWAFPPLALGVGAFVVLNVVANVWLNAKLRGHANARVGESICTFARSFDCRAVDTRLIRATFEEIRALAMPDFPLRRSDRLAEEFGIVDEDLDDLAYEIARRAGRSMEDIESNPRYDQGVATVGDLILFLNEQPMAA